jgi:prepilin-type N-terminal cleavage/methylation domain-containing protein
MQELPRERGFTLLELMVVVSVIAILAMIALPSYLDRIIRDQIAEALPLADLAKAPVELAWRTGAALPAAHDRARTGPHERAGGVVAVAVQVGRRWEPLWRGPHTTASMAKPHAGGLRRAIRWGACAGRSCGPAGLREPKAYRATRT